MDRNTRTGMRLLPHQLRGTDWNKQKESRRGGLTFFEFSTKIANIWNVSIKNAHFVDHSFDYTAIFWILTEKSILGFLVIWIVGTLFFQLHFVVSRDLIPFQLHSMKCVETGSAQVVDSVCFFFSQRKFSLSTLLRTFNRVFLKIQIFHTSTLKLRKHIFL